LAAAASGRGSGRSAADGLEAAERNAQSAADDFVGQLDDANKRAANIEGSGMAGGDVKGDMLKPSPANNPRVRGLAIGAAIALAARGTGYLPARAAAFAHLLAWAALLGANLWTTFFAGLTMFRNLPRQVFGKLQSKLFPQYFWLETGSAAVALATLHYSGTGILRPQLITLGVALAGSLANQLFVEPTATKLMFQRYELENAPQRDNDTIKALYKKFSTWHGISSMLNLGVLVAAVTHGWWLAASVLRVAI
jgi:hypothetical protein